jgi:hypothetical protein
MEQYKAYTYLLKFKLTGKVYYGVRFKNIRLKLHPHEDFMIRYTTSSEQINSLIAEYGLTAFTWKIRQTFDTPEQAIAWETRVLLRCDVLKRQDIWYNANIAGHKITTTKGRQVISDTHKGVPKSEEHKNKIRDRLTGVKKTYVQSAEQRQKNSDAHKGKNHPMYGVVLSLEDRLKRGEKNKGKIPYNKGAVKPQEEKDKATATREANKQLCEHCGKTNVKGLHKRWHGDKCKLKP